MITPDHIKFNKGMGFTFHALSKGNIEGLYDFTRVVDGNIRKGLDDTTYYYNVTNSCSLKYMHDTLGMYKDYCGGKIVPVMRIELVRHIKDDQIKAYEHKTELVLLVGHHVDGIIIPVRLHYPISYAMVNKDRVSKSGSDKLIDIEFYDADNNLVAHVIQDDDGDYWQEIRCRAGKFIYDAGMKANKNKKETGGCFFCDNAEYKKENGIIYLACTKYGGQIAETEYDGVGYPEYCKRRA